jgi:type I restriction enzyme S subunit
MKWSESTLGAIIDADGGIIQTGPFGSQLHQNEYQPEGVPVIMPKDISDGRVLEDSVARVSEQTANRLARHKLQFGSIVLPRRGEIAKRALISREQEGWLCGTGCVKIELAADSRLLAEFLYYYMDQDPTVRWLEQHAVGTTMLNLNTQIVGDLPIRYPDRDVQRTIVDILSAYDTMIENSRRRIRLLEEAARLLYQEWFVRFRFPGHEHVEIIDGVPDGWARKQLNDICSSVDYGYTASSESDEVGPKFLRITDIVPEQIDWSAVPYCSIPEDKLEKFLVHEGEIVIARTGATVGFAKRLDSRIPTAVFASYLVRLRIDPKIDNFIVGTFVESEAYKDFVRSRIGGAAQPNANAKVLTAAQILIPPKPLQLAFREVVEPLINQKGVLQLQNLKLRAARDLLLPRLMSGEVEV